jgi:hypothetical protein
MSDFAPPSTPPPPKVPEGWKAQWNDQYKEWFYVVSKAFLCLDGVSGILQIAPDQTILMRRRNRISTRKRASGIAPPSPSILLLAMMLPQDLLQDIPAVVRRMPATQNPTPTKPTTTLTSNLTPLSPHDSKPKKMTVLAVPREVGTPCKITRIPLCRPNHPVTSKSFPQESRSGVSLAS